MIISIVPNLDNDGVKELTKRIIEQLHSLNCVIYINNEYESIFDDGSITFCPEDCLYNDCDVAIAVGGDGTTLNVAKNASVKNKPTLGINAGRVGFMSGLEKNELHLLENVVNGKCTVEERMMIRACIYEDNSVKGEYHCLNDAVISRGDLARLIDISVSSREGMITKVRADGIIISTPTGSTAYSMAAGGPVLSPDNSCFVITPICPHTLANRSIIVSSDKELNINIDNDRNNNSFLSVDGVKSVQITPQTKVVISKSPYSAKLIKVKSENFYEILNKKIIERRI